METTQAIARACPVCDGVEHVGFWTKGSLCLVRCVGCGMVFANPVAPELASGSFYQELAQPFYLSREKLESDYASVRFERELRLFRRYCRGGRVLDVGCSTGSFLFQLQNRWPKQYEALGTDVAEEALAYAVSRGVPVLREPFLRYASEPVFAAVTCWAVLEHVLEPKRFLSKAAGLLQQGGHCFVLVPNFQSLAIRCLQARYRYVMEEHVNYFTVSSLRELARREHGLVLKEIRTTHFNPVVLWQDSRRPRERVPDVERAQLLERTTRWKQRPWLEPLKLVYRLVEAMLGKMYLADNLVMVLQKK